MPFPPAFPLVLSQASNFPAPIRCASCSVGVLTYSRNQVLVCQTGNGATEPLCTSCAENADPDLALTARAVTRWNRALAWWRAHVTRRNRSAA
jgi:hypothetical protein